MGCGGNCGGNANKIAGERKAPVERKPANTSRPVVGNKPPVKSTVVIRNGKKVSG